jgi:hypothetical protein
MKFAIEASDLRGQKKMMACTLSVLYVRQVVCAGQYNNNSQRPMLQEANSAYMVRLVASVSCILTLTLQLQAVRLNESKTHWTRHCAADDPDFLSYRPWI